MAWYYCSKRDVKEYSGFSEDRLHDSWSEMVEGMIDKHAGKSYMEVTAYTDSLDGDGTDTVFLKHYPIVAVSSLAISDTAVTASEYKVYQEGYIRLTSITGTSIEKALGDNDTTFPVGQQNVAVSYTAGSASVPEDVRLAAILMVTQIALISERAGAEGSLALGLTGGSTTGEKDQQTWRLDVSGRLRRILRSLIGEKWKFA